MIICSVLVNLSLRLQLASVIIFECFLSFFADENLMCIHEFLFTLMISVRYQAGEKSSW